MVARVAITVPTVNRPSQWVDLEIELWDTEKGERKRLVPITKSAELPDITFSSNGELMALTYIGGTIELRNMTKETEDFIFKGAPRNVDSVAFSQNGRFIALRGEEAI